MAPSIPPQTIILVPVHTAVWFVRGVGALVVLVIIQLLFTGLYIPPVLKRALGLLPHQMIISMPVHTAVCLKRPAGALVVLNAVQVFVLGLYLPPVLT